MSAYFEISKNEYVNILKNRGKTVSSSISMNKLLKKVKYLTKKDLKHLLTIRNIDINNDNLTENIINTLSKDIHEKKQAKVITDLFTYHHKQKINNLEQEINRNIHKKKQAKVIIDLFRYHHKQKLNNLEQEINRNIPKRQNQSIINELNKLRLSNL